MSQKKEKSSQKFTAFDEAAAYGAMYDKLNIRNITFWTFMGLGVLVAVVAGVMALYNFNKFQFQERASIESEFNEQARERVRQDARLNTQGVIDQEAGIYHIPIDDAITLIINESEQ